MTVEAAPARAPAPDLEAASVLEGEASVYLDTAVAKAKGRQDAEAAHNLRLFASRLARARALRNLPTD